MVFIFFLCFSAESRIYLRILQRPTYFNRFSQTLSFYFFALFPLFLFVSNVACGRILRYETLSFCFLVRFFPFFLRVRCSPLDSVLSMAAFHDVSKQTRDCFLECKKRVVELSICSPTKQNPRLRTPTLLSIFLFFYNCV